MSQSATSASSAGQYQWRTERRPIDWKSTMGTALVSFLFHAGLFFACTFVVFNNEKLEEVFTTILQDQDDPPPIVEQTPVVPADLKEEQVDSTPQDVATEVVKETSSQVNIDINDLDPTTVVDDFSSAEAGLNLKIGDQLAGRTSAAAKAQLVRQQGGSNASEIAVASGMRWLKNHQAKDGGWSFGHRKEGECDDSCAGEGSMPHCRTAATSMALLTFLGGGHTHNKKGDYREQVRGAIDYLIKQGKQTPKGIDYCSEVKANEKMYAHGITALALCEAAAMSKDDRVRNVANGAIKFILNSQNPKEGGWRYQGNPAEGGDTSVVGWQLMALKSAQIAKLKPPKAAFVGVEKFLSAVSDESGGRYAYELSQKEKKQFSNPMTAVGLLCRIYLGWDAEREGMKVGVGVLDKAKPSVNDMYYNYYATQVIHHWGGEEWKRWNEVMREQLVRTQGRDGHGAGSWANTDPHGGPGGRLYMTCLATMTLEVYYRHLPIYQRDKVKVEF